MGDVEGKRNFSNLEILGSLAGFLGLSAAMTWPQVIVAGHSNFSPDVLLHLWELKWDFHALSTDPLNLFNPNIFYPSPGALALGDHSLGILPLWLLFFLPSGNAYASLNWTGIALYGLTGWATYLLARYWTASVWGAIGAGILAGFHPIKMYHFNILTLASYHWVPLILLALSLYRDSSRRLWLVVIAAMFGIQLMCGFYNGYAASLALGAYLLVFWTINREWRKPMRILLPALALSAGMAANVPLDMKYIGQQRERAIINPAEGQELFLPKMPEDFLKTAPFNRFYGQLMGMGSATVPQPMFPGVVFPILMLMGAIHLFRGARAGAQRKPQLRDTRGALLLFGVPGILLAAISLGAHPIVFGKRITFPIYILLARLLPGFHNIRVPQRFSYTALIFGAIFAAYGVAALSEKGKSKKGRAMIGGACSAMLLAECWMAPFHLNLKPEFQEMPPIYKWLRDAKITGGVIELPFDSKNGFVRALYNVMSLTHMKPIANGYNAYAPPPYWQMMHAVPKLPDEDALRLLDLAGVSTIIEHRDFDTWLTAPYPEHLFAGPLVTAGKPLEEAQGKGLEQIAKFGADSAWRIVLPPIETVSTGVIEVRRIFRASSGEDVIIISVSGDGGRIWKNSRPSEGVTSRLIWRLIGHGVAADQELRIPLPIAALAGDLGQTFVFAQFPETAGVYELEIRLRDDRVRGTVQRVTITGIGRQQ